MNALSAIAETIGDRAEAIEHYRRALGRGDSRALNYLGRVHLLNESAGDGRLRLSETLLRLGLQRAYALEPGDAGMAEEDIRDLRFQLHRNLGWSLLLQWKSDPSDPDALEPSRRELERASAIDRSLATRQVGTRMAECLLVEVYRLQGKERERRAAWRSCLEEGRPETIAEYQWLVGLGERDLADCLDTSSIVRLPNDARPYELFDHCESAGPSSPPPGTPTTPPSWDPGASRATERAVSPSEASAWIGRRARYEAARASFHGEACEEALYASRVIGSGDLLAHCRVPAAALGLPHDGICVTEVGRPQTWTSPGAILIHADDAVYTLWDGTFFALKRE